MCYSIESFECPYCGVVQGIDRLLNSQQYSTDGLYCEDCCGDVTDAVRKHFKEIEDEMEYERNFREVDYHSEELYWSLFY